MWIEVAVADPRAPGGFRVLVGGGAGGRLLEDHERLDKTQRGLRNFQAVLWDGTPGGEAILQNETVKVLTGKEANQNGFPDREQYLLPGEIRSIPIECGVRRGDRVRVRLLFRALPPEFLTRLGERLAATPPDHLYPTPDLARRARDASALAAMPTRLRIFEMATATR
jgi:hypothetical protein